MTKQEILQELETLASQKRILRGKESLLGFVEIYLKKHLESRTPDFHREIMGFLEDLSSDDPEKITKLLIQAPRGFAKSFVCSFFFPLWVVLYARKKDVMIVSATIALSKRILRFIRTELEDNELLMRDFGDMESEKWTEDQIILKNGAQISAKGRGFQIRGFRPDVIICDDLEDEESIYSPEQREKTEHWFFRTLIPTLKPDQAMVYVGTQLHQFSLIAKLEKRQEFKPLFYAALTDGKSIWEEQWPTEELNKRRKEMGEYAFQAEYMNNPISLEEQPVKPHMVEGVEIGGKLDYSVLAIDPAISLKTSSDPRAFVIMGRYVDKEGDVTGFKEIHSEAGKWGVDEQIDRIIRIFKSYEPNRVVVEEVAFQKIFSKQLIDRARKEGIFIPISRAELGVGSNKRPKDKYTRLMEVVHLFEQKLVELRNPELIQQILAFPHADHDDLVDATVFSLYPLMKHARGLTTAKKDLMGSSFDSKKAPIFQEIRPGVWGSIDREPDLNMGKRARILAIGKK